MAHECSPACHASHDTTGKGCECSCGGKSHGQASQPVPAASSDGTVIAASPAAMPRARREALAEEATIEARTGRTPPGLQAARDEHFGTVPERPADLRQAQETHAARVREIEREYLTQVEEEDSRRQQAITAASRQWAERLAEAEKLLSRADDPDERDRRLTAYENAAIDANRQHNEQWGRAISETTTRDKDLISRRQEALERADQQLVAAGGTPPEHPSPAVRPGEIARARAALAAAENPAAQHAGPTDVQRTTVQQVSHLLGERLRLSDENGRGRTLNIPASGVKYVYDGENPNAIEVKIPRRRRSVRVAYDPGSDLYDVKVTDFDREGITVVHEREHDGIYVEALGELITAPRPRSRA